VQQPDLITLFIAPLNRLGVNYIVTGAVAATVYGEPRLTHDVDIVLALDARDVPRLRDAFDRREFYVPDRETIDAELERPAGGHFNIIHIGSAQKADFYPVASDPLHYWALQHRRRIRVGSDDIAMAPPEYVILRKLEYLRASGSDRHRRDIRAMMRMLGDELDVDFIAGEVKRLGLKAEWTDVAGP
jgi:hypothetical protein